MCECRCEMSVYVSLRGKLVGESETETRAYIMMCLRGLDFVLVIVMVMVSRRGQCPACLWGVRDHGSFPRGVSPTTLARMVPRGHRLPQDATLRSKKASKQACGSKTS